MICLLFITSAYSAPSDLEVADAKRSIQSLISPLLPGKSKERPKGTEAFRVDGCEKKKIDWMAVLMMKTTATVEFKFKEGCDVQGTIEPKVFQPFPANLDLRNIQSYNKVSTQNKITTTLESKPILNLNMVEGILTGKKGIVKFEADYQVQINPVDRKKPLEKNLGGELRITEIYGKKVSIKEKILVQ